MDMQRFLALYVCIFAMGLFKSLLLLLLVLSGSVEFHPTFEFFVFWPSYATFNDVLSVPLGVLGLWLTWPHIEWKY